MKNPIQLGNVTIAQIQFYPDINRPGKYELKIETNEGWDKIQTPKTQIIEETIHGYLHYGSENGLVRFFYTTKHPSDGHGTDYKWSSRAGVVNKRLTNREQRCISVNLEGLGCYAITLAKAFEILEVYGNNEYQLEFTCDDDGEIVYRFTK